jgi:hypothetical protein
VAFSRGGLSAFCFLLFPMPLAAKTLRALAKLHLQKFHRYLPFFTSRIAHLFLRQSVLLVVSVLRKIVATIYRSAAKDCHPTASLTRNDTQTYKGETCA